MRKSIPSWRQLNRPRLEYTRRLAQDEADQALTASCSLQLMLPLRPHMRNGYVESEDAAVHCLDEVRQPRLQSRKLLAAFAANP